KIGPKSLARQEHTKRRYRVKIEGYCPQQAAQERITIADVLALVVADYKANGRRALGEVERHEKRLAAFFGPKRDAADLTTGDIDAYAAFRRQSGAAVATVNRELSCLRRGLRLARQRDRLDSVPHVALAAEHNVRIGFFEEGAFRGLVAAAPP